jgi:hypothetical protein
LPLDSQDFQFIAKAVYHVLRLLWRLFYRMSYRICIYPIVSCVIYPIVSCVYPIVSCVYPILPCVYLSVSFTMSRKNVGGTVSRHENDVNRSNIMMIDYLLFYVPLKNFSCVLRRHHYRWMAAKCRPLLAPQGLWAGRDPYRATAAVTRDLGFSGLIRRTASFSRLLRHTCKGVWRIYSNPYPHSVDSYDTQEDAEGLF